MIALCFGSRSLCFCESLRSGPRCATVQDNAITNVLVTGISASINVELRVCGNEVFTVSSNPSSPAGTEVIGISIGGAVNAVIEGNTVGIIAPPAASMRPACISSTSSAGA